MHSNSINNYIFSNLSLKSLERPLFPFPTITKPSSSIFFSLAKSNFGITWSLISLQRRFSFQNLTPPTASRSLSIHFSILFPFQKAKHRCLRSQNQQKHNFHNCIMINSQTFTILQKFEHPISPNLTNNSS